jgi:hypothetical protein
MSHSINVLMSISLRLISKESSPGFQIKKMKYGKRCLELKMIKKKEYKVCKKNKIYQNLRLNFYKNISMKYKQSLIFSKSCKLLVYLGLIS